MNTNIFSSFTNSYSISKTLRFELIPQGKTLEYIEKGEFIGKDQKRADDYKEMKKTIDAYHRDFIEKAMLILKNEADAHKKTKDLNEKDKRDFFKYNEFNDFFATYITFKKDRRANKKAYEKACEQLRKRITQRSFESSGLKDIYNGLFKEELIKKHLEAFIARSGDESLFFSDTFKRFTTYFTGFHENRKNMYTFEEKSTAIAYRAVNENLPKFIDNIENYEKVKVHNVLSSLSDEEREFLEKCGLSYFFTLEGFIHCLSQTGIEKYNALIGGKTEEGGIKYKGLNEILNLYNQKCTEKSQRMPLFKVLYKQILSDREAVSFLPEAFANTQEVYEAIQHYYHDNILANSNPKAAKIGDLLKDIQALFELLKHGDFNTKHLYLGKVHLNKLSSKIFGRYNFITEALESFYKTSPQFNYIEALQKANTEKKKEKLEAEKNNFIQKDYHSLANIQEAIVIYAEEIEDSSIKEQAKINIAGYFADNFKISIDEKNYTFKDALKARYSTIKGEIETEHDLSYRPTEERIGTIKIFLDTLMELVHFVQMLMIRRKDFNTLETDNSFYTVLKPLYEELAKSISLYDKVRNFATKKPYSTEKIKLTFNKPTLANGWDENKEKDNMCVLLQKESKMYLGIINEKTGSLFDTDAVKTNAKECYRKMVYKFFPDVTKMIPKCSMTKDVKKHFSTENSEDFILNVPKTFSKPLTISREIFKLNNPDDGGIKQFQKDYLRTTQDEKGYKEAVQKWITFCLDFVKSYKSTAHYDLSALRPTHDYEDIPSFYDDINKLLYSIEFKDISCEYIEDLVENGKLLLFQIHNKDYNKGSHGKANLHTLYWNAVFSQENLRDTVIKLNGEAELFYRKASIKDNAVFSHKKGNALVNKTTQDGEVIPDGIYREIYKVATKSLPYADLKDDGKKYYDRSIIKEATHEIIKDRRYTQDKFLFHVPITLNFKPNKETRLNDAVLEKIKDNPDVNIIGIDRGERNLLYYTVINQSGEILAQRSLNVLEEKRNDQTRRKVDYHNKLDNKERERDDSRKNWKSIGKIAELKQGYLSHVVHETCQLIKQYNAIVVLEDLNFGFKRGRFKVEKQVYQNFEKALINKLNYLCFKDEEPKEKGGILNAFQLTEAFKSFKDMGKQNGILFYLPASHTSKIDPVTGFVDRLKPSYQNKSQAQEFFSKFDKICYDSVQQCFDFTYNESKFTPTGSKTWTVKTFGDMRYFWNKRANSNKGAMEKINVTQEFIKLFESADIDYKTADLKEALIKCDNATLLSGAIFSLRLVLAMRYSYEKDDFILSPIANSKGKCFYSPDASDKLPKDADANGAYNIARKGLLMLNRLKAGIDRPLILSNQDWFDYAQGEDVVEKQSQKL